MLGQPSTLTEPARGCSLCQCCPLAAEPPRSWDVPKKPSGLQGRLRAHEKLSQCSLQKCQEQLLQQLQFLAPTRTPLPQHRAAQVISITRALCYLGNAKHAAEFWFKNSYLLGNHISTGLMIYSTRGVSGHPKEYYCISKYDWKTLSVFVIWPLFSNSNDNSFYILFLLLPVWRRTLTV